MLYVGLGDGGAANDPQDNGQKPGALLGKMLRLDVDGASLVPSDNPFVGREGWRPEIWAYGLRNPWRYVFAPDGRLVVADVGQNLWEEVSVVGRGDNMGWARREGAHCFPPKRQCSAEGMVDPIHEYGREEGISITGGVFATGDAVPALRGKYLFADFGSGRFWAIDLPKGVQRVDTVHSLGRWPVTPSAFGRDAAGNVYVADFARGIVYRFVSP
jgi:glucose/arabinose dehydrogenase